MNKRRRKEVKKRGRIKRRKKKKFKNRKRIQKDLEKAHLTVVPIKVKVAFRYPSCRDVKLYTIEETKCNKRPRT